jgi:hypothetical protein
MWEVARKTKPLGVRLYGDGFKRDGAAKLAGEKALRELLDGILQIEGDVWPYRLVFHDTRK